MRFERRRRAEPVKNADDLPLCHYDLLVIFESEEESRFIDETLGEPSSTFTGEVRLSDGYGEHYLLIQPKRIELGRGDFREVARDEG